MVNLYGTTTDDLAIVASTPNTEDPAEVKALTSAAKVLADYLGGPVAIHAAASSAVGDEADTLTVTVHRRTG